jgi:thiol-disulfide isomerase/thioredoxin
VSNVIELNEANFDREVLNATQPVWVEFRAGWFDPCKAMAPMLKSVAEDKAVPVKVRDKAVEGAKAADEAVRDNPYQAIGIAFGVGEIVGYLAMRRYSRTGD